MTLRQKVAATWAGVHVVAAYELRVRHRARGWRWLLALWFLLVTAGAAAIGVVVYRSEDWTEPTEVPDVHYGASEPGAPAFGAVVPILLGLLLLIVPALARPPDGRFAQGARTAPALAGLEAREIALGELVAAWAVVGILLLLSVPALAVTVAMGGVGVATAATALGVLAVVLGVVAALAQWRPGWTYAILLALTAGTPLAYAWAEPLTEHTVTERNRVDGMATGTHTERRPDRVWWLLAPNPFVVVADAAHPGLAPDSDADQLTAISLDVRDKRGAAGPAWPRGLAFLAVVGTGAVGVTIRRLQVQRDKVIIT